jgi:hypothetical protein
MAKKQETSKVEEVLKGKKGQYAQDFLNTVSAITETEKKIEGLQITLRDLKTRKERLEAVLAFATEVEDAATEIDITKLMKQ